MADELRELALAAKAPASRDPSFADPALMFHVACSPDAILALYAERDEARDKAEGLEADLDEAVRIAFKYGAKTWVQMNYPAQYATLTQEPPHG